MLRLTSEALRSFSRVATGVVGLGLLSANLSGQLARVVEEQPSARQALAGSVFLPDGSPAAGAVVVTSAGGQAVTATDGSFALLVEIPLDASSVEVTAVADEPGGLGSLSASVRFVPSAFGPTSSAGRLTLALSPNCHPRWLPTFGGPPGTDGTVHALAVFDDGSGPALYGGGGFGGAAGLPASRVARWDGSRWSALGSGMNSESLVRALAVYDDGSGPALYAGGSFTSVGGVAASRIAKWDGASWSALGSGIGGDLAEVLSLAVFDDGGGAELYVGGDFTSAGGAAAHRIAKWDGAGWSPLGSGAGAGSPGSQWVGAVRVFDDGSGPALYAGGNFGQAGGLTARGVARWNGASWSVLGGGITYQFGDVVSTLAVYDDGSGPALYAGGEFSTPGFNIAKWNGSSWSSLDSGMVGGSSEVFALAVHDDGGGPALFVGGNFPTAGGVTANGIARWDGSSWTAVGSGTSAGVRSLLAYDDGGGPILAAGGGFSSAGGVTVFNIAQWNGSNWSGLGGNPNAIDRGVSAFSIFDDGGGPALYAGGAFVTAGGTTLNGIGKLVGSSWVALGGGMGGPVHVVDSLTAFDDGSGPALYAGGEFTSAGGTPAVRVARWDGVSWTALGSGIGSRVRTLIGFDDGSGPELHAGSGFSSASKVERWDGSSWSTLGGGMSDAVFALAVFDDGGGPGLYAGGAFARAGGVTTNGVARWDGSSWSALSGGMGGITPQVFALAVFDDGSGPALYVGGEFSAAGGVSANRIAKWDGSGWSAVGGGMSGYGVNALAVHDDGRGPALHAAGLIGKRVAKWNGSDWLTLGTGIDDVVLALVSWRDGHGPALFAGGEFDASPAGDAHFAKWACRPVPLR